MSKGVRLNAYWKNEFLKLAILSEEELKILDYRLAEVPNSFIADKMGISMRTLHRRIDDLILKYEDVRKINPALPRPYKSQKELWMDTH